LVRLAVERKGNDGVDVDQDHTEHRDEQESLAVLGHRHEGALQDVVLHDHVQQMEAKQVAVSEDASSRHANKDEVVDELEEERSADVLLKKEK